MIVFFVSRSMHGFCFDLLGAFVIFFLERITSCLNHMLKKEEVTLHKAPLADDHDSRVKACFTRSLDLAETRYMPAFSSPQSLHTPHELAT